MRAAWKRCALAALFIGMLLRAPVAFADSQTFNAIFFTPATGRNPYLMLQGTDTLHQLQFDVGGYFSYGYHPLDLLQNGTRVQGVIDHLLVFDLVAAIGALEWLEFGIDVPLVLVNSFRSPDAPAGAPSANHFNLSDIRFEAKARVLDACATHFGLAFVPFITFPTGSDAHYVGDPGMTGGVKIAFDGRINKNVALTMNVGYQGGRKVLISNVEWQHRLLIGGGVQGNLNHGVDVFGEINAIAAFNKLFHDRDMNPTEAMVGARWDIKETGVELQGGAGTCLVCGVKGSRFRAVLGAKYRFNTPKYREMDAVKGPVCMGGLSKARIYELKKNCPQNPADWKEGVHDTDCPKFYELREVAGLILRCPDRPEDFRPGVHDPACPKVFDLSTLYGRDEVKNIVALAASEMRLMCPQDPGSFNPQIHDLACPKYYDLEESQELSKRCPKDANAYRSGIDDPGCPKYYTLRDEYGDVDWATIKNLRKIDMDRYGSAISGGEIQTLRPIYFEFNRSVLLPTAMETIDQVVKVINETPWVSTVRIGGHADAIGTAEANEEISLRRAQVVIDALRAHGVRPDVQLNPVAYGSNRPAAPNDTELGRSLNRRVVFTISTYKVPQFTPPPKKKGTSGKKNKAAPEPAAAPASVSPAPEVEPPPARWEP